MLRRARTLTLRPYQPGDEPWMTSVAARVFASWDRDPARTVTSMMRAGARAEIALAQHDPVGYFVVSSKELGRPYGPWSSPCVAHLDAIAVAPEAQGQRLGRSITRRAEEVARESGAVVMTLMTATGNVRARRLFERCGFLAVLRSDSSYANGDSAIHMFKMLAPSPDRGR